MAEGKNGGGYDSNLGHREAIAENLDSHAESRGETVEIKRRLQELEAQRKALLDQLMVRAKEIEGIELEMGAEGIEKLARFALEGWYGDAYHKLANELGIEIDDNYGPSQVWDWLRGGELTFSHGDLEVNPGTGEIYANEARKRTSDIRGAALSKLIEFVDTELGK